MKDVQKLSEQVNELKRLRDIAGMNRRQFADYFSMPIRTIEDWEAGRRKMPEYLLLLMSYKVKLENTQHNKKLYKETTDEGKSNIDIITDADGNRIVVINDIRFKGRQNIEWRNVEKYLKEYVGKCYEITQTAEKVYIGSDFPDEFTGSKDTKGLRGASAKAKANASQGLGEMIQIADGKTVTPNYEEKHNRDAKYGWYRYDTRFAIPVYDESGSVYRYNVFKARMLVRHADDGKLYLYDLLRIKKETSRPHKQ